MFNKSFTNFKGLPSQAEWLNRYRQALDTLQGNTGPKDVLNAALDRWREANALLAADPQYHAAERYCIQQQFLGQISDAYAARFPQTPAGRTILNCAREVLEATPAAARPLDQSFLQLPGIIQKTLDHLQQVAAFYRQTSGVAAGRESLESFHASLVNLPDPPATSAGFLCTFVLKADVDIFLARHFWTRFKALNTQVRLVTLGDDAAARQAAETADPIVFAPGGAQKPGRCLWVQKQDLHPDVHQWLQEQGFAQVDAARCVFMKATGKLSAVLKKTDIIDETAVLDEFFNASA